MLVLMKHVPLKNAGLSYSSRKLVDIDDYVSVLSDDVTPVFVVCFIFISVIEACDL